MSQNVSKEEKKRKMLLSEAVGLDLETHLNWITFYFLFY